MSKMIIKQLVIKEKFHYWKITKRIYIKTYYSICGEFYYYNGKDLIKMKNLKHLLNYIDEQRRDLIITKILTR
jgi:hypothetical protein